MLKNLFAKRPRRAEATDDRALDAARDPEGGRDHDESAESAAADVPVATAANSDPASTQTRYPLSWPARDLARTQRLASRVRSEPASEGNGRREEGESSEDDPTKVWPRREVEDRG